MIARAASLALTIAFAACRDEVTDPEPVPAAYVALEAPAGPFDAASWRPMFIDNCAPCHGTNGRGDGPGSVGLEPRPASFSAPGFLAARSDGYLFWRISEGKPGTAMPSFKDSLSPDERFALVRYLRDTWQD